MRLLVTPREACARLDMAREWVPREVEFLPTDRPVQDRDQLRRLLASVDGAVLDVEHVDAEVLPETARLGVISRFGVGYDAISVPVLQARGVSLCNTPGVMADAVARQALALALALVFRITEHDRALKAGRWTRKPNLSVPGTTLGVVGLGAIGSAVARLADAIGFRVLAYSRTARLDGVAVVGDLDELIGRSDLISLHLALRPETAGIIGWDRLATMRGKYLINTARGGLVDEAAVCRALDEGLLAGYATDVFGREPVEGESARLAAHPGVVACPHVAAYDDATAEAMLRRSVMNAVHCLQGEHDRVNAYVFRASRA
jgi:phosphoglycerate dehydrogenase-like enzyme